MENLPLSTSEALFQENLNKENQKKQQSPLAEISEYFEEQENFQQANYQIKEIIDQQDKKADFNKEIEIQEDNIQVLDSNFSLSPNLQTNESDQGFEPKCGFDADFFKRNSRQLEQDTFKEQSTRDFLVIPQLNTSKAQRNSKRYSGQVSFRLNDLSIDSFASSANSAIQKIKFNLKNLKPTGNEPKDIEEIILTINRILKQNGKIPEQLQTQVHAVGKKLSHQSGLKHMFNFSGRINISSMTPSVNSFGGANSSLKRRTENSFQ